MNPLDYRCHEGIVIVRDREGLVDELSSHAQPADDLMVLQPTERQPVSRTADDLSDGAVKPEYALTVAPLHSGKRTPWLYAEALDG